MGKTTVAVGDRFKMTGANADHPAQGHTFAVVNADHKTFANENGDAFLTRDEVAVEERAFVLAHIGDLIAPALTITAA